MTIWAVSVETVITSQVPKKRIVGFSWILDATFQPLFFNISRLNFNQIQNSLLFLIQKLGSNSSLCFWKTALTSLGKSSREWELSLGFLVLSNSDTTCDRFGKPSKLSILVSGKLSRDLVELPTQTDINLIQIHWWSAKYLGQESVLLNNLRLGELWNSALTRSGINWEIPRLESTCSISSKCRLAIKSTLYSQPIDEFLRKGQKKFKKHSSMACNFQGYSNNSELNSLENSSPNNWKESTRAKTSCLSKFNMIRKLNAM